jgi:ubiquitin carboxyl-terminal hydrolase 14
MIIHVVCVQGLKTELEKASPTLGRTAIYTRESRINELPRHEHIFTFCLSFLV